MKKVLLFLISFSFLVMPCFVNAAGFCADENIREYRKELNKIEYEYNIKYDNVENKDESGAPVNYINLSVEGLTDKFMALVIDSGDNSQLISGSTAKVSGGVNTIYFYYKECTNEPVKTEEIFLPYYDKSSVKAFDDGSIKTSAPKLNSIFITIGLCIAAIGLFVLAIFILKKGRQK